MRSIRLVVPLLFLLFAATISSQQVPSLLASLNNEFMGRPFTAKILIGRSTTRATTSGQAHIVDTEVDAGGGVNYLVRGLWPAVHIGVGGITMSYGPGKQLYISKVELKDDRIEFTVSQSPNALRTDPRLKLMLGKGYEGWEYSRIEEVASHALRIERLEIVAHLRSEYGNLQTQLAAAKSADSSISAADLDAQIASKERLADLYKALASNRMELAAQGHPDTESTAFLKQEQQMRADIARLTQLRTAAEQSKLAQSANEIKQQYLTLKQQISSTHNVDQKREKLQRAKQMLDDLGGNYSHQQALGVNVDAETAWLAIQEQTLERSSADLLNQAQRQHQNDLESQYRAMQQKREILQTAFNNADQSQKSAAGTALLRQLQQMRDNRISAATAGSEKARKEAEGLNMVIQHLQASLNH